MKVVLKLIKILWNLFKISAPVVILILVAVIVNLNAEKTRIEKEHSDFRSSVPNDMEKVYTINDKNSKIAKSISKVVYNYEDTRNATMREEFTYGVLCRMKMCKDVEDTASTGGVSKDKFVDSFQDIKSILKKYKIEKSKSS